ncbi:MAG: fibronectin type III domain-containing protein [Sideroxydans sp.]|nr:fibronectin type III domain-containing protein [Sideroxydans sp.]
MHLTPSLRKATELGFALTAVAALILAGCGGGSSSSGSSSAATTTTTITPYKGMFTSGTVTLTDANGNAVTLSAGGTINASGVASVTYPANVAYPLTIEVSGTFLDETSGVGATGTISAGAPLRGLIPAATDAQASSGVPVTVVTELARTMLPASGFSAASAVAAITGAASSVLGSTYGEAMTAPVFNAQGQTSNITTLKLTALAHVINQQGAGANLPARLQNIASQLAAGSAVNAVIPQSAFNNALGAINGGASSVLPVGATPPTIPTFTLPSGSLGGAIGGSGGSVAPTPSITGFNPTTGAVGTSVTVTGTNLVSGFPPAPAFKFGTTNAGGPYTNVSNTSITFTVPAGLAAGTHTITVGGTSGTPVTVGTFTVTTPGATVPAVPTGLTATTISSSQVNLNWTAAANATGYNIYRANAAYVATSLANKITATPITGTSYNDTGLTAGTTYYYRVATVNAALQSMPTPDASATTTAAGGGISATNPPVFSTNLCTTHTPGTGILSGLVYHTYCSAAVVPSFQNLTLTNTASGGTTPAGTVCSASYDSATGVLTATDGTATRTIVMAGANTSMVTENTNFPLYRAINPSNTNWDGSYIAVSWNSSGVLSGITYYGPSDVGSFSCK